MKASRLAVVSAGKVTAIVAMQLNYVQSVSILLEVTNGRISLQILPHSCRYLFSVQRNFSRLWQVSSRSLVVVDEFGLRSVLAECSKSVYRPFLIATTYGTPSAKLQRFFGAAPI